MERESIKWKKNSKTKNKQCFIYSKSQAENYTVMTSSVGHARALCCLSIWMRSHVWHMNGERHLFLPFGVRPDESKTNECSVK